ncbi:hypothetical protein [Prochlorococcus sp. MIT 1223]|uniref:hypothetical protein n=1 Tax=Prochlorococcus sp. MIT 1223 TaxID=3096217 RepID=UPI002A75BA62|nr:hypothetical protein [Prochlorococcus sp. MIT 1223]
MKRLLLPLLAAFALPTAASAESYWLLLTHSKYETFEKIEMGSLDQCEEMGALFVSSKRLNMPIAPAWKPGFECFEGK